jgi:nucleoside-diphosphate-sugar epimerase
MKKILITGASGFWGYNVLKYINDNYKHLFDITCVYNTNEDVLKGFDVKKIQCCLEKDSEIEKIDNDYDIILHLASIIKHTHNNSNTNININLKSSQNIFELARKIGKKKKIKVICASTVGTVACFNNESQYANENSEFATQSFEFPYYYSKILIERLGKIYRNDNVNIIFIRPPVIYGENDIKGRATSRIKKFLDKKIILYTKGNIPFCDVEDLTKITYDIIQQENTHKIYNIDGYPITVKKFYETLEELSGQKKIKIYIPYYFGIVFIYIFRNIFKLPDIVEFYMGNCFWNSKSIHLNNYKWIDYKETLKKTINYIKKNKNNVKNDNNYGKDRLYPLLFGGLIFLFLSKFFI